MNFQLSPGQRYDCVQCGRSCQGWGIKVEPRIEQGLREHPLTLRVIQERGAAFRQENDALYLNMTREMPRCGYLEADDLCGVHRTLGARAKPSTCRQYPFILTQTPDGIYAGLAFSCTAARANLGRPMDEHVASLQALVQDGTLLNLVGSDGLPVHDGWFTSWNDYLQWEARLRAAAETIGLEAALGQAAANLAAELGRQANRRSPAWRPLSLNNLTGGASAASQAVVTETLLTSLAGQGRAAHFDPHRDRAPLDTELEKQIEVFLEHLVFRKALVIHPTLLSNLCLLSVLPSFLRCQTRALAGSAQPTLEHYWEALDVAEKSLVYHTRALEPLYHQAARQLVAAAR